jgi:hypothetical protein
MISSPEGPGNLPNPVSGSDSSPPYTLGGMALWCSTNCHVTLAPSLPAATHRPSRVLLLVLTITMPERSLLKMREGCVKKLAGRANLGRMGWHRVG